MRLLVVDNEELMAAAVAEGLRQEAFAVDIAHDGAEALDKLAVNGYDVLILGLPRVHGDEVCRRVVAAGTGVRVLMLSVFVSDADRVAGLSMGADDHLAKPFAFAELVARVRALGRRSRLPVPPVLERSGVRLDPRHRETYRDGRYVHLAREEVAVLEELLRADGAVVSAETLLEKVWDENMDPLTTIVCVTIGGLRRKLGEPQLIETVTAGVTGCHERFLARQPAGAPYPHGRADVPVRGQRGARRRADPGSEQHGLQPVGGLHTQVGEVQHGRRRGLQADHHGLDA
ncbi:DNA-binding response OmpR family regulator [Micromonospora kangleipakensis]|uniref:DNA-binding response OmpR family regulator n=1 Tax=Micromonospora kangleipakensis TaxID=1077942 RepID=A0A4V2GDQ3_9ACTN|nr:DNA-binding response OmpR family regulator [Micromonospora kangleipakensis]